MSRMTSSDDDDGDESAAIEEMLSVTEPTRKLTLDEEHSLRVAEEYDDEEEMRDRGELMTIDEGEARTRSLEEANEWDNYESHISGECEPEW